MQYAEARSLIAEEDPLERVTDRKREGERAGARTITEEASLLLSLCSAVASMVPNNGSSSPFKPKKNKPKPDDLTPTRVGFSQSHSPRGGGDLALGRTHGDHGRGAHMGHASAREAFISTGRLTLPSTTPPPLSQCSDKKKGNSKRRGVA